MALAQRLAELERTHVAKTSYHLELLRVFAAHGQNASVGESADFLQRLRKARDALSEKLTKSPTATDRRSALQKWTSDCSTHDGFRLLRERFFVQEGLQSLPNAEISRAYNQLRRLNLGGDARQLWPLLSSRIAAGGMTKAKELLGIWSVAPEEHLLEIDAPLARALGSEEDPRMWKIVGAFARAAEWPDSETVKYCAGKLAERLVDLSSEDLASVVARLGSRPAATGVGALPDALAGLTERAKGELISRDGRLETQQLCGLLGVITDRDDVLWPMVRKQLLTKTDLSAQQAMQVCEFIHRTGGREEEPLLFGSVVKHLAKLLNTKAQPGVVALVARSLDAIASDVYACQCLMNAAVRLRKDLFPAVLWRLFMRTGEVDLVSRHPTLQLRLQRIGESLEQHGVQVQRTTLKEMVAMVEAMGKNRVVLKKCASQMAEHFVEVMRRTEASEAVGEVKPGEMLAEDAREVSLELTGVADTNWLAEVQKLMISFWVKLTLLDIEDEALTAAMTSFCMAGGHCSIEAAGLVSSVLELESVQDVRTTPLIEGLVDKLTAAVPEMSQRSLAEVSSLATSGVLRRTLTGEVVRRLSLGGSTTVSMLRRGDDFDDVLAILARWSSWLRGPALGGQLPEDAAGAPQLEHVRRVMHLVADSLPSILEQDPKAARIRLAATVTAFAAYEPDGAVPLGPVRHCLQQEMGRACAWEPGLAAELAFSLSALHARSLPFDVATRLWRLAGLVLGKGIDGLPELQAASLWASCLAVKHLSSPTACAALRLSVEAPAVEAFLTQAEKSTRPRFQLSPDSGDPRLVPQLRTALPDALPGQRWAERFPVPATPYVVDLALQEQQLLLVVPRADHRAAGHLGLSAAARLMENTLGAIGWRLEWVWPEQWSASLTTLVEGTADNKEETLEALRGLIGTTNCEGIPQAH